MYDLLIIGGGPAGLSAAMTARNRNLTVCVICGCAADSALYKAGHVTNYPGVPDVSGPAPVSYTHLTLPTTLTV